MQEPVGRPGFLLNNVVVGDGLLAVVGINDITLLPPDAAYGPTNLPHPVSPAETIHVPVAEVPIDKALNGERNLSKELKSALRLDWRSRVIQDRKGRILPRLPRPDSIVEQPDPVLATLMASEASSARNVIPNQGKSFSFVSAASFCPSLFPAPSPLLAAATRNGLLYLYKRTPTRLRRVIEDVGSFVASVKEKAAAEAQKGGGAKQGRDDDGGAEAVAEGEEGGAGRAGTGSDAGKRRAAGNSGTSAWLDILSAESRLALQRSVVSIGALAWSPPTPLGSVLAVGGSGIIELLLMRGDNADARLQPVSTIALALPTSTSSSPFVEGAPTSSPFIQHPLCEKQERPLVLLSKPLSRSSSSSYFEQQSNYRAVLDEICAPWAADEAKKAVKEAYDTLKRKDEAKKKKKEGAAMMVEDDGPSMAELERQVQEAAATARNKVMRAEKAIRYAASVYRATAPSVTSLAWLQRPAHTAATAPVGIGGDNDGDENSSKDNSNNSLRLLAAGCSDGSIHLFSVDSTEAVAEAATHIATLAPSQYRCAPVTCLAWQQLQSDSSRAVLAFSRGQTIGCWEHELVFPFAAPSSSSSSGASSSAVILRGLTSANAAAAAGHPSAPSSSSPSTPLLQARLRWSIETGDVYHHFQRGDGSRSTSTSSNNAMEVDDDQSTASRYWVVSNASDSVISGVALLLSRQSSFAFPNAPSSSAKAKTLASLLGLTNDNDNDATAAGGPSVAFQPSSPLYLLTSGLDGSVRAWSLDAIRALVFPPATGGATGAVASAIREPVMTVLFSGISTSEGGDRLAHRVGNDILMGLGLSPSGLFAYVSCLREKATASGGADRSVPDVRLALRSVSLNALFITPRDVDKEAEALLSLVAMGMRPDPAEVPEWHLRKRAEAEILAEDKEKRKRQTRSSKKLLRHSSGAAAHAIQVDEGDYEEEAEEQAEEEEKEDLETRIKRRLDSLKAGDDDHGLGGTSSSSSSSFSSSLFLRPLGPAAALAAGPLSASLQRNVLNIGRSLAQKATSDASAAALSSSILGRPRPLTVLGGSASGPLVVPSDADDVCSSSVFNALCPPINPAASDLVSCLWSLGELAVSLERKFVRDAASSVGHVYQGLPVAWLPKVPNGRKQDGQPTLGSSVIDSAFGTAAAHDSVASGKVVPAFASLSPYECLTPENLPALYPYLPRQYSEALAIPLDPHPGGSSFRAGTMPVELLPHQRVLGFSRETVDLLMRPFTSFDAIGVAGLMEAQKGHSPSGGGSSNCSSSSDDDSERGRNGTESSFLAARRRLISAFVSRAFLHLDGLHTRGKETGRDESRSEAFFLRPATISLLRNHRLGTTAMIAAISAAGKTAIGASGSRSLVVPPVLPVHLALQHLLPLVCNQLLAAGANTYHQHQQQYQQHGRQKRQQNSDLQVMLASCSARLQYLRLVVFLCSSTVQGHIYASERTFGPFAFDGYSHAYMRQREFEREAYLKAQDNKVPVPVAIAVSGLDAVGGAGGGGRSASAAGRSSDSASSSKSAAVAAVVPGDDRDEAVAALNKRFAETKGLRNFGMAVPADVAAIIAGATLTGEEASSSAAAGSSSSSSASGSAATKTTTVPIRSIGLPAHPLPPPISDGPKLQVVDGRGNLVEVQNSRTNHPSFAVPIQQRFAFLGFDFPLVSEFATQPPRWLWYACAMGTSAATLAQADWMTAMMCAALLRLKDKLGEGALAGQDDGGDEDDDKDKDHGAGGGNRSSVAGFLKKLGLGSFAALPLTSSGGSSSSSSSSSSSAVGHAAAGSASRPSLTEVLKGAAQKQQRVFATSLAVLAAEDKPIVQGGKTVIAAKEGLNSGGMASLTNDLGLLAATADAGVSLASLVERGITEQDHLAEARAAGVTAIMKKTTKASAGAKNGGLRRGPRKPRGNAAGGGGGNDEEEEDEEEEIPLDGPRPKRKAAAKSIEATKKLLEATQNAGDDDDDDSSTSTEDDSEDEGGSQPAASSSSSSSSAAAATPVVPPLLLASVGAPAAAAGGKKAPAKKAAAAKSKEKKKQAAKGRKKKGSDDDDDESFDGSEDDEDSTTSTGTEDFDTTEESSEGEEGSEDEEDDDDKPKGRGKNKNKPAAKPKAAAKKKAAGGDDEGDDDDDADGDGGKAPKALGRAAKAALAAARRHEFNVALKAKTKELLREPVQVASKEARTVSEPLVVLVASKDATKARAALTSAKGAASSAPSSADGDDIVSASISRLKQSGITFVSLPLRRVLTLRRLAKRCREVLVPALRTSFVMSQTAVSSLFPGAADAIEPLCARLAQLASAVEQLFSDVALPKHHCPACGSALRDAAAVERKNGAGLVSTIDFSPLFSSPFAWMTEQIALQPPPIFTMRRCLAAMETGCGTLIMRAVDKEEAGEEEEEQAQWEPFGLPVLKCAGDGREGAAGGSRRQHTVRLHPVTLEPLLDSDAAGDPSSSDPASAGNIDAPSERLLRMTTHPASTRPPVAGLPTLSAGLEAGSVTGLWWC